MRDALLRIAERYPDRPKRYPLLGPDTIQDLVAENTYDDLTVLPPRCFSPLGPTMTSQYFQSHRRRTLERLAKWIVKSDTYAIHWGSNGISAKSIPQSDEDLKRADGVQLFSRLALKAAFPGGLAIT